MGFFRRRAKAKLEPTDFDHDDFAIASSRRPKIQQHLRYRQDRYNHEHRHKYEEREAHIQELPPEPEMEERDDNGSVGETLATEDHFDLHVPIKDKHPKKGILRNRSGQGLMLLPSGRSFSRRWNASDSVSSVSCDSLLFQDHGDDNSQRHHHENQTISMRSIKSRQSKQSTIKHNNRPDPPLKARETTAVLSSVEDLKHKPTQPAVCSGCWFWSAEKRDDIPTRIPSTNDPPTSTAARMTNTVRGIKVPQNGEESLMNSTIPTYATEYHIPLQTGDDRKDADKSPPSISRNPPQSSFKQKTGGPFFLNLCGPRHLPPEDLLADDTTTPLFADEEPYRTYEQQLEFEKRDRSLFDPYSSYDDDGSGDEYLPQRQQYRDKERREEEEYDDDQGTSPTYMDEGQTTMAMMEMGDIPVYDEERDNEYGYHDGGQMQGNDYDDNEDFYHDHEGHNWGIRLPRKLPKVRNLARMSSLSKLRSFRSSNRSHKSGRSGKSRGRRRRHGASPRAHDDEYSNNNGGRRRRSRSRGHSPGRRSLSKPRYRRASERYGVPKDYFTSNDKGKRYYR